ncbi:MAG: acyltransferase [Steroidobacteraceae bacterium]
MSALSSSSAMRKPGFNPGINGFRGICVLLVFAYHVAHSGLLDWQGLPAAIRGGAEYFADSWRYGVELFFMISGFVIVASLRRHGNVAAFLRDRCLRIFPAWLPVHLTLFFVGSAIGWKFLASHDVVQNVVVFTANLLLLPPLIPVAVMHPASWSLSYEWLFYLLAAAAWSLAGYSASRYSILRAALWLAWGAAVLSLLGWLPRAVFFIPGVIIALGWLPLERWRPVLRWPLLSLLMFLLAWRMVNLDQAEPGAYPMDVLLTDARPIYAAIAFMAGLHLFACLCATRVEWLQRASLQFLGNISYSFYLWHPLVMFGVKKLVKATALPELNAALAVTVFALVSFGLALLVSWLSYRYCEQRLAKWLHAMSHKPVSPVPAVPIVVSGVVSEAVPASAEGSRI